MSTARGGRGRESDAYAGSKDPRNLLVEVVIEATLELEPRVLVLENVPAFLTRKVLHPVTNEPVSAAVFLVDALSEAYDVVPVVTNLADHGVPQTRKRCFLTFIRSNDAALEGGRRAKVAPYPRSLPEEHRMPLREALRAMHLRELDAATYAASRDPDRPLHFVPVWSASQYAMVAAIPSNSAASAWSNLRCPACGAVETNLDAAKCSKCESLLLRPVVSVGGAARLVRGFRRSSYSRMDPEEPAATITTASGRVGSDNTIHPSENRVLSVLECQLLQGIPTEFKWGDCLKQKGHTAVRSMIGEVVPPLFTRQHGRVLAALLAGRRPYMAMPADDRRVAKAQRLLETARSSVIESLASPQPMTGR
jgi:DNA (cytosine-5)-methyltransferase 1